MPKSPDAARNFLVSQNHLDKPKGPITSSALVGILTECSLMPDIPPVVAAVIKSVALLIPDAVSREELILGGLKGIGESVERVVGKVDQEAELAKARWEEEKAAGERVASDLTERWNELVDKVATTHDSSCMRMETLVQRLEELEKGMGRGAPGAAQAPASGPRTYAEAVVSAPTGDFLLEAEARADLYARKITVEPGREGCDSLSSLSEIELLAKAKLALERVRGKVEGGPTVLFQTVEKLPKGGVRYTLGSREEADWLCSGEVACEFEVGMGDVVFHGQAAQLLVESIPVDFDVSHKEKLREWEKENGLAVGEFVKAGWIKPVARRSPTQKFAYAKVVLRSQAAAEKLILGQCVVGYMRRNARRIKMEPLRCAKCQSFRHLQAKCKAEKEVCSGCGGEHHHNRCDNKEKFWCANCKTGDHSSWARGCPAFVKACSEMDGRRPENRWRLFGRADPGPATSLLQRIGERVVDSPNTPAPPTRQGRLEDFIGRSRQPWHARRSTPPHQPPPPPPRHISPDWDLATAPTQEEGATPASQLVDNDATPRAPSNRPPLAPYSPSRPHVDTPARLATPPPSLPLTPVSQQ